MEFKNLSIGYSHVPLVHLPEISIEKGEIIGIVGPNGSGKSTLLRTLTCSLPIVDGDVRLHTKDGREIMLIQEGRFVLPGTEELNEVLKELDK